MSGLNSHGFPAEVCGVSASQAVEKASHCQCPSALQQIHSPGDRKERAGSVWEKKGTVRKRRRGKEEIRGVAYTQHWSERRWEEFKNPIAYGGGREYAEELKSQELTEEYRLSGAKGFGFLRYHLVPLKGQRMQLYYL